MIMNKLATGITVIAIATTAISVPAKANNNKELNTLLAILAGGLIINEIVDKKKDRKEAAKIERDESITHQHRNGKWHTHRNLEELKRYHRKNRKSDRRYKNSIQDTYFELPFPEKCERTLSGRFGQTKHGLSRKCLRRHGYRVEDNGRVTHPKYRNRAARPRLF